MVPCERSFVAVAHTHHSFFPTQPINRESSRGLLLKALEWPTRPSSGTPRGTARDSYRRQRARQAYTCTCTLQPSRDDALTSHESRETCHDVTGAERRPRRFIVYVILAVLFCALAIVYWLLPRCTQTRRLADWLRPPGRSWWWAHNTRIVASVRVGLNMKRRRRREQ